MYLCFYITICLVISLYFMWLKKRESTRWLKVKGYVARTLQKKNGRFLNSCGLFENLRDTTFLKSPRVVGSISSPLLLFAVVYVWLVHLYYCMQEKSKLRDAPLCLFLCIDDYNMVNHDLMCSIFRFLRFNIYK